MTECTALHPEFKVTCHKTGMHKHHTCQIKVGVVKQTVSWPNEDYIGPNAPANLNSAVERVREADRQRTGFAAGVAASEASADARWNDEQQALVLHAIGTVARVRPTFTTQHVWDALGPSVPVTKGMTGMLMRAKGEGWIENSGQLDIRTGGGAHDHGQRLTVWRSLICGQPKEILIGD